MLLRFLPRLPSSHYVLLSFLFFVGFELIFIFHQHALLFALGLLALLAAGIILIRAEDKDHFTPTAIILPTLAASGFIGFSLFLPVNPPFSSLLHLYFALASVVFLFILKHGARRAYPTWNWGISLLVYFLNIATILGWRFYLYIPVITTLLCLYLVSWLISWQAIRRFCSSRSETTFLSLTLAFVLTQAGWVLQFLPLYYLIQTGVLVVFFYTFFNLIRRSYEVRLSHKDFAEYGTVGAIAVLIILLTAQWI